MTHPLSNDAVTQNFNEAAQTVREALRNNNLATLELGLKLYRDAKSLARTIGADWIEHAGVSKVRGAVDYKDVIKSYKDNTLAQHMFTLLLHYFPPTTADIIGQDKHQIDVDRLLVESLLRHTSLDDQNPLLRKLGMTSSRKAFSLMLDHHFKQRLFAADNGEGIDKNSAGIFPQLNAYKPAARAIEALPNDIFAVLMKYPAQILEEHQARVNQRTGSTLNLSILQGLLARSASNEAMTDVVLQIAGNSILKLHDMSHVLWAEQQGVDIDQDKILRAITNSALDEIQIKASLYYMLLSPKFPASELARAPRLIPFLSNVKLFSEPMAQACKAYNQDPDMYQAFPEQAGALIKAMLRKKEEFGMTLLDTPGLPRRQLAKDPALIEHIFSGDLGL